MAIEVALEDDVYFADLNRQISLLIDDDDDYSVSQYSTVPQVIFSLVFFSLFLVFFQCNYLSLSN